LSSLEEAETSLTSPPPPEPCSVGEWVSKQRDSLQKAIREAEEMDPKKKTSMAIYETLKKLEGVDPFPVKYNQYRKHRVRKCGCYES
jgi:hypothetical protein